MQNHLSNDVEIVIVQRIFAHYRKPFFDRLSEIFKIKLLHGRIDNNIKQIKASYSLPIDIYKYGPKSTQYFLNVFRKLIKLKPKIVIHEFSLSIISLPVVLLFKDIIGYKVILWGHGYNYKHKFNPYTRIDSFIRLLFMRWADATIVYGIKAKEIIDNYIEPQKIFVAQNTLDIKNLIMIRNRLEKQGKDLVKKRLGFKKEFNIIFIGRLIKSKLPARCIDILNILNNNLSNRVSLHFVGDGPEKNNLIEYVDNLDLNSSVYFHGAIYDDDISGKYLYASDLLLLPGHLGLSVNHALAFNCPVFSFKEDIQSGLYHSPESEYVVQGETGFFAEPYDLIELSNMIENYLTDNELQKNIGKRIKIKVENELSIDSMVNGFVECINICNRRKSQ